MATGQNLEAARKAKSASAGQASTQQVEWIIVRTEEFAGLTCITYGSV